MAAGVPDILSVRWRQDLAVLRYWTHGKRGAWLDIFQPDP